MPATLEGCVDYMVVSEEKLNALKAAIRAAKKTDMPAEALKQLTTQAQQLGEAVIQTKIKIGELTSELEKADHDRGNQYVAKCEPRTQPKKEDQLHDLGLSRFRAAECERLARHQDAVLADVKRVKERGEVPSTKRALEIASAYEREGKQQIIGEEKRARSRHKEFQKMDMPTIEDVKKESEDITSIRNQMRRSLMNFEMKIIGVRNDFESNKAIVATSGDTVKKLMINDLEIVISESQRIIEIIKET